MSRVITQSRWAGIILATTIVVGEPGSVSAEPPEPLRSFEPAYEPLLLSRGAEPPPIRGTSYRVYHQNTMLFAGGGSYGSVDNWLPRRREGEIVPLFGSLYRAKGSGFEWLKDEDAPRDLAVMPDSIAIPLRRDDVGLGKFGHHGITKEEFTSTTIFVMSIDLPSPDDGKGLIARIAINDIRSAPRKIRRGDFLKFGLDTFEVRNIVPLQRGVIGWVELRLVVPKQRPAEIVFDKETLQLKALGKADAAKEKAVRNVDDPRQAWISETFTDNKGRKWMPALWTHVPGVLKREKAKVDYPPLTTNDIVPLFGRIYRVIDIADDAIEFQELRPDELPRGIAAPAPGSVFIPLKSDRGVVLLDDRRLPGDGYEHLYLDRISATDRAHMLMERPHLGGSGVPLHAGRKFELGIISTVRNIVPRDESRQIIGWAEIDGKPVEDEANAKPRNPHNPANDQRFYLNLSDVLAYARAIQTTELSG